MFNKEWFSKNQTLLCWFANTWFGKWVLRINGKRSSVGKNKIIAIFPNAIFWKGKKNELIAEFRTHNKFTKRLFHAFKPVWYLLHWWDTFIANNFRPAWNLGLDTLTTYPDPDPESTSVDGEVRRNATDSTWAAARETAGGTEAASSSSPNYVVSEFTSTWNCYRLFFLFDTSSLTAGATISAATFSMYNTGVNSGNQAVGIVQTSPASNTNLVVGDYDALTLDSPAEATTSRVALTANQYNDFVFNATGIGFISLTSITKLGARANRDIDDIQPPTTPRQYNEIRMADHTGTASDPKLVVTYTAGFTTSQFIQSNGIIPA